MGPGDGWVELAGSASKADTANWGWALGAGTFSQVQVPTVPCPSSLGGRGGVRESLLGAIEVRPRLR